MQTQRFILLCEKQWYLEYTAISELNVTEVSTHMVSMLSKTRILLHPTFYIDESQTIRK
jgi:hypothetical protein